MPHIKYDKVKLERYKLEIQRILDRFNPPSSPLDENPGVGERAPPPVPIDPHDTATTSVSESGTPLASPLLPAPLSFLNFNTLACGRLIRRTFALHEFPSLIEAISLSKDEIDVVDCLSGDDAQALIDVIDEVSPTPAHLSEHVN